MIEWKTLQIYLALFAVYIISSWYFFKLNDFMVLIGVSTIAGIFMYYEMFVYRKYPVIVPLFVKRKGRFSFILERASRRKDENNVEYYLLRQTKKKTKPPRFKNIIETTKGYVLPLFSPTNDEYREISINKEGNLNVIDEDMKQWYKYWTKKVHSDWAPEMSMWVRYLPVINMAVLGGIIIVILYIITGELAMMTSSFTEAAKTLLSGINALQGGLGGAPPA